MARAESIGWTEKMVTGVPEMDRQHRVLVDTLVDAREKLVGETGGPLFDQVTQDLLAYAINHFDTEERLMQAHGYALAAPREAEAHLAEHRRFSERVVSLRAEARYGGSGSRTALIDFLTDWLLNHILTVDQRLGRFLRASEATGPRLR